MDHLLLQELVTAVQELQDTETSNQLSRVNDTLDVTNGWLESMADSLATIAEKMPEAKA